MDRLRKAVGAADACELTAAMFSFPDEALAEALADGRLLSDAASCVREIGYSVGIDALDPLGDFVGRETAGLLDALRKGHSLLYLAPGGKTPVWPYESAFLFVENGGQGIPTLFRSAVTVDVEHCMREAGVLPETARKEPADSVWDELSFMSYLYGNVAKALYEGRAEDAVGWSGRAVSFWDDHVSEWLPAFMRKAIEEAPRLSYGAEYAVLAEAGLVILGAIREDIESRRVA